MSRHKKHPAATATPPIETTPTSASESPSAGGAAPGAAGETIGEGTTQAPFSDTPDVLSTPFAELESPTAQGIVVPMPPLEEIAKVVRKNFGDIFEVLLVDGEIIITAVPKSMAIRTPPGGFVGYSLDAFETTLVQACAAYARILDRAMNSASARLDTSSMAGGPAVANDGPAPVPCFLCGDTGEVHEKTAVDCVATKACPACRGE